MVIKTPDLGLQRVTQPHVRLIPRLDVKNENLIKGVQLEGLRVLGCPLSFAREYYEAGASELLLIDAVASLYGRNQLLDLVGQVSDEIFIPLTVGGGIRSAKDAEDVLRAGADKVAVNSAIIHKPFLIDELAREFGSQAVVASIEVKSIDHDFRVMCENGRELTQKELLPWIRECIDRGVGEIVLTSVDRDGTLRGMNTELAKTVGKLSIPFVLSGGLKSALEAEYLSELKILDGIAVGSALHYGKATIKELRRRIHGFNGPARRED